MPTPRELLEALAIGCLMGAPWIVSILDNIGG